MNRSAALIDFKISDLDLMETDVDTEYGDFKKRVRQVIKLGEAKTISHKGIILGAMGYFELWPGVCEVWIFSTKEINESQINKGVFAYVIRDALNRFIDPKKFHRVQATAEDNIMNEYFFTKLGFVCEGLLEKYSMTKQNYKMWARVK